MRYIVTRGDPPEYLTARRPTGRLYENRAQWSEYMADAKVFQTKAAAVQANKAGETDYKVRGVVIMLAPED